MRRFRPLGAAFLQVNGRANENDLPTFASALSYQTVSAIVPVILAGLALLGFLDLTEVWEDQVLPRLEEQTGPETYAFLDASIGVVVGERRGFWLTIGLLIAIWQISGAVRVVMGASSRIYHAREMRPFVRRMLVSIVLSVVVAICLGLALVALHFGPRIITWLAPETRIGAAFLFIARWGAAAIFFYAVVAVLLHFGPAVHQRISRAWLSAGLIVAGWILVSLGFRWYASTVASYDDTFGNLATLIVVFIYVYLSSIVFLYGMQIDSLVRQGEVTGPSEKPGDSGNPRASESSGGSENARKFEDSGEFSEGADRGTDRTEGPSSRRRSASDA